MSELSEAIKNLEETKTIDLVDKKINEGISPLEILSECNEGMVEVGNLFSDGSYFLSELMFSAEIFKKVQARLEPLLDRSEDEATNGTVVIGTVKGDIHDIGKNLVISLLKGYGFNVIDLGVDVPAEHFVKTVLESGAKVLGLSALLNSTYPEMKNVIDALKEADIRDKITVIVGGAPCNKQVKDYTGADFNAQDAMVGVRICQQVYQK